MYFALHEFEIRSKMGDDFDVMNFGQSMKDIWKAPNGQFLTSDTGSIKIPDVSSWAPHVLVFSQKAYDLLPNHLTEYGEMLPVNIESNNYYMFNMMHMLDDSIIDQDKSKKAIFEGAEVGISNLTFKNNLINDDILIFTLPYVGGTTIFCGDKFKNLIEELKITGITFDTKLTIDPLEGLEGIDLDYY